MTISVENILDASLALPSLFSSNESGSGPIIDGFLLLLEHLHQLLLQIIHILNEDGANLLLGRGQLPVGGNSDSRNRAFHGDRLKEAALLFHLLHCSNKTISVVVHID